MSEKRTEACGRCAMSSVVSVSTADKDETERERADPFSGDCIEVDERELRAVSPGAWLSRLTRRLDSAVTKLVYGRQ